MYRRNSDSELRELERQFAQSGDPALMIQINHMRSRAGLPPNPVSRIKAAQELLSEIMCRGVASQIREFVDTYLDPAMHLAEIPEDTEMRDRALQTLEDYERFTSEWRIISNEAIGAQMGQQEEPEYVQLLNRYGLNASPLGPEEEIPETPEGYVAFLPAAAYRTGMRGRLDNFYVVSRFVCQQSIRAFRNLQLLGFVNFQEIIAEEGEEMAEAWSDYPLGVIENYLNQVETALDEIDRASMGVNPSQEAVELFSAQWYGN